MDDKHVLEAIKGKKKKSLEIKIQMSPDDEDLSVAGPVSGLPMEGDAAVIPKKGSNGKDQINMQSDSQEQQKESDLAPSADKGMKPEEKNQPSASDDEEAAGLRSTLGSFDEDMPKPDKRLTVGEQARLLMKKKLMSMKSK